jgi:hypothetical protein
MPSRFTSPTTIEHSILTPAFIEGWSPYLDEALTVPLYENQAGLAAEHIVYSRIVGGTHHSADLNNAVFNLASQVGLVGLVHDADNAHDPNAIAVRGVANKTIYTAGYLPRALAAVVAPIVGTGGAANAAVIETVSRGGKRVGLKVIAAVGRDLLVTSVGSASQVIPELPCACQAVRVAVTAPHTPPAVA